MTEEERTQMTRDNYVAQMRMLGFEPDGNPKDMVEVVRCKDCKYYDLNTGVCSKEHVHGYSETWYCADGERRSNRDE